MLYTRVMEIKYNKAGYPVGMGEMALRGCSGVYYWLMPGGERLLFEAFFTDPEGYGCYPNHIEPLVGSD